MAEISPLAGKPAPHRSSSTSRGSSTPTTSEGANPFLADDLRGVARVPFDRASTASTTHRHEYLDAYVRDLPSVVDLDAIRRSGVRIGVDPLGGASVAYWDAIGEKYGLDLEVVNHTVDPRRASKTRLTWSIVSEAQAMVSNALESSDRGRGSQAERQ
jgi:phosphoglucomutase